MEGYRYETGKSTIPEYVSSSGELTTDSTNPNILLWSGGDITANDVINVNQLQNLYVYEDSSAHGSVRKVKAVHTAAGVLSSVEVDTPFASPLANEPLKLVFATLASYSVANSGGANGYINGELFKTGTSVSISPTSTAMQARTRDAIAIDGTGTGLQITEVI